jgi:hypothetical protein
MCANHVRRLGFIPGPASPPSGVPSSGAPVFLHTGWRTAGTWLWSRFREVPGTHCFYEPLHEAMASLSRDEIARVRSNSWASGHPALARPYYDEYAGLLNADGIGVRAYRPGFAIDRLLCPPEAELAGLGTYFGGLIAAARENGAVPVMKFCRSMGRMAWMRQNFPQAVHVAVLRNPASQWASARRQYARHDNPYFMAATLRTVAANRGAPMVERMIDALGVRLPVLAGGDIAEDLAVCVADMARRTPEAAYRVFLAFWLLAALSAAGAADMVVDTDLMALSPAYREVACRDLSALTGIALDLETASQEDAGLSGAGPAAGLGLEPREMLRCHADAQRVLLGWPGEPEMSVGVVRASAMLSFASLLGAPEGAVLRAAGLQWLPEWDGIVAEAHLLEDRLRLERLARQASERELSALRNSHSWTLTAPLRAATTRVRALMSWRVPVGMEGGPEPTAHGK